MKSTFLQSVLVVLLASMSLGQALKPEECSVYMQNDVKNLQRSIYAFELAGQEECCIKCQSLPAVTAFTVDSIKGCLCKTELPVVSTAVIDSVATPPLKLAKRSESHGAMNIDLRIAGQLIDFDALNFFRRMAVAFHYPINDIIGTSLMPGASSILVIFHVKGSDAEVARFQDSLISMVTEGSLSRSLNATVMELIMTPLVGPTPAHVPSPNDNDDSEDDGLPLYKSYNVHVNRWAIRGAVVLGFGFGLFLITYFISTYYYNNKFQNQPAYEPVSTVAGEDKCDDYDDNKDVSLDSAKKLDHVVVDVAITPAA